MNLVITLYFAHTFWTCDCRLCVDCHANISFETRGIMFCLSSALSTPKPSFLTVLLLRPSGRLWLQVTALGPVMVL